MTGGEPDEPLPFLIDLGEQLSERAARDEAELGRRRGRFWRAGRARGDERRDLRGRRRVAVLAAGAASVAVAVALALNVDFGDDGSGGTGRVVAPTPATAHAVLSDLARRARAQPDAMPAPGQLFFVRSLTTRLQGGGRPPSAARTTIVTYDRRVWSSPSQPGRLYETAITSQPLLGGPITRMGNLDAPQETPPTGGYALGRLRLTRAQLLRFPTAPGAIVARLRAAQPGAGTPDLFDGIAQALREAPAPPAMRAGLLRALSRLPGVRPLGRTRDSRGRPAVAIGLSAPDGTRTDLLLDPSTAEMLAERETLLDPAASRAYAYLPRGTVLTSTVYLRRAAVDTVSDQ